MLVLRIKFVVKHCVNILGLFIFVSTSASKALANLRTFMWLVDSTRFDKEVDTALNIAELSCHRLFYLPLLVFVKALHL